MCIPYCQSEFVAITLFDDDILVLGAMFVGANFRMGKDFRVCHEGYNLLFEGFLPVIYDDISSELDVWLVADNFDLFCLVEMVPRNPVNDLPQIYLILFLVQGYIDNFGVIK